MKSDIWVITADTHKARLFRAAEPHSKQIEEIKTFLQPDTVLPERELASDNLGRHAHSMRVPRTSPKEKRVLEFAREVAHFLETEHKRGEFYKLGLVAAPSMLGELRAQFSPELERDLCFEIDKNLTQMPPDELRRHLPERLAPSANMS